MKNLNIEIPSVAEVERCLKIWHESPKYEKYRHQERSVRMLFKQFPMNTEIEEVLVKVCVLNKFYSTGIPDVLELPVAQHIKELKIDDSLAHADVEIIDKIARVTTKEKVRRFYSFATKYCCHHRIDDYPICDSLVREGLKYFRDKEKFYKFKNIDLMHYETFKKIILEFRKCYGLDGFCLRELDLYLWVLGKEKYNETNLENE